MLWKRHRHDWEYKTFQQWVDARNGAPTRVVARRKCRTCEKQDTRSWGYGAAVDDIIWELGLDPANFPSRKA